MTTVGRLYRRSREQPKRMGRRRPGDMVEAGPRDVLASDCFHQAMLAAVYKFHAGKISEGSVMALCL
ncbi:hypothetical protein [Marivita sp.]|uniref:hypothetical protein n=1 Tax=Marivita sp. TaxID=2003365 RepID=UPI003A8396B3